MTFRLSQDEYDSLTKACAAQGARSISEFARLAVLRRVQTLGPQTVSFADDLTTVSSQLQELHGALNELNRTIARVLGKGRGAGSNGSGDGETA